MLYVIPLIFALVGLVLYGVLAGADFGAGFWQLTAGGGEFGARVRERAHTSMAPVWEANHVWLIFVLVMMWTAYPRAFGSIASTLSAALLLAGFGIVLRGAAYALRSGSTAPREQRAIDTVFGVSSLVAPFALGAAAGGIAAGRVPVGNAAGGLFSSWLGPTSILVGALAVLTGAYLAAVFLSGDAAHADQPDLARWFRLRALVTGTVAGAVALAGLFVLRSDARPVFDGLLRGGGLAALIASVACGAATLGLVWRERFEAARYTAAGAVAAIVAGWALAQGPRLLPGLTVRQAAAPHDALVAVIIAVVAGALVLFPSLLTLFRLALSGRLGEAESEAGPESRSAAWASGGASAFRAGQPSSPALVRLAGAFLLAGIGLVNVADAEWAHLVGSLCFLGFLLSALRLALPLTAPR